MTEAKVTVYGAYWCPDCRRSKRFLGEQFIPYRWVDIEQDKKGEAFVLQKNNGKRFFKSSTSTVMPLSNPTFNGGFPYALGGIVKSTGLNPSRRLKA